MSNHNAKEQAAFNHFSPEDFLRQDELLKQIADEYTTSLAAPNTTTTDPNQFVEDIMFTVLPTMEPVNKSEAEAEAEEEEDSETKLHFRNRVQAEHTVDAEKKAIAHWIAVPNS